MEWGSGEIPALSANNVEMGRINFSKECYLASEALYQKWMTKGDTQKGDVILTTEAPLGNVAVIPDEQRYILSQRVILLRANSADLCSDYLSHYLMSEGFQNLMRQQSSGTTATGIQRAKLEPLLIKFPSSKIEQEKIAAVLSKIDLAITQIEAIIAKQQRIKTGLMQDLLTKGIDENGNIRSEATHEFKDSAIGRIPVEWDVKPLHKLSNHVIDCPHTTPIFIMSGVLVSRTFNIKNGGLDLENASFISESEYDKRTSRLEPKPRDLIFTREAPVGEAFIIPEGLKVCLGQRTMLIRCNEILLNPNYLLESLYSEDMKACFDRMVGGTTNPHLNVADVRNLLIKKPSLQEQINIAQTLAKVRSSLTIAQKRKSQLQLVKTGLMQDLLAMAALGFY